MEKPGKKIILNMALQICSAMRYLEKNGFIHQDLVRACRKGGLGREGGQQIASEASTWNFESKFQFIYMAWAVFRNGESS